MLKHHTALRGEKVGRVPLKTYVKSVACYMDSVWLNVFLRKVQTAFWVLFTHNRSSSTVKASSWGGGHAGSQSRPQTQQMAGMQV